MEKVPCECLLGILLCEASKALGAASSLLNCPDPFNWKAIVRTTSTKSTISEKA